MKKFYLKAALLLLAFPTTWPTQSHAGLSDLSPWFRQKSRTFSLRRQGESKYAEHVFKTYYPELTQNEPTQTAVLELEQTGLTRSEIREILLSPSTPISTAPDPVKPALVRLYLKHPKEVVALGSELAECKAALECMQGKITKLYQALDHLELAREVETNFTPQLMGLVNTRDGTIGAVIPKGMPIEFLGNLGIGKPSKVLAAKWSSLTFLQKKTILITVATHIRKTVDFYQDRNIYGLKIDEKSPYSSFFTNQLEHVSSGPDLEKIEMHARGRGLLASEFARKMDDVFASLHSKSGAFHTHIPGKVPKNLRVQRKLTAARMVEFGYRTSLAAELIQLVKGNYRITKKYREKITFIQPMTEDGVQFALKHFLGRKKNLGRSADGYTRIRGQDTYDQPGLWGIEVRLTESIDRTFTGQFLDAVQFGVQTSSFGIPAENIRRWVKSRAPLSYNREWSSLFSSMAPETSAAFDKILDRTQSTKEQFVKANSYRREEKTYSAEGMDLKLLFNDWSKHPLFLMDPEACAKIVQHQIKALEAIADGQNPKGVIAQFATESGLFEKVMGSFGLQ